MSLEARAWLGIAALGVVMALLLFLPAGTAAWWEGWLYLTIFIGASVLTTLDLIKRDPALLERRMHGGPTAEERPAQKLIMLGASLCFLAILVVPAFDHRFGWSDLPTVVVLAGDVLVAIGFALVARVFRENSFTSATIEIAADQKVISTGPYAIVRHPMYASAALYVLGTPLALGSYRGLVPAVTMLALVVWRLLDEERFLAHDLPGYAEYRERVPHRLVPFVW